MGRGMIADFAIHQPDKEDGGIPNPHFMFPAPSGLSQTANGVLQPPLAVWTRTGTALWERTASPSLTLFPLPTGEARKHWNIGGRRGPLW